MKKRFSTSIFESVDRYLEYCLKKLQPTAIELCNLLDEQLQPNMFLIAINCQSPAVPSILHIVPQTIDFGFLAESEQKARQVIDVFSKMKGNDDFQPQLATNLIGQTFTNFMQSLHRSVYLSEAKSVDKFVIFGACVVSSSPIENRYVLQEKREATVSLIDGALKNFVKAIPPFLLEELSPIAILKSTSFPSTYEILRNAAKNLITRVSFNIPPAEKIKESLPLLRRQSTFFEDINGISRLSYENEQAAGNIIIASRDHSSLEIWVEFAKPVWTHDLRASRKLLEISDNEVGLLVWNGEFYGLGKVRDDYDVNSESIFTIEMRGHYTWSLHHGTHNLMVTSYEQPRLHKDESSDYIDEFQRALQSEFKKEELDTQVLSELFKMALEQPHGTMLVVSSHAKSEASRLQTQSTVIKPIALSGLLMRRITSIDGAVVIDSKGICHAVGAILDGVIEAGKGDPSRGARFNAAIKYLSHCQRERINCLIVVFSEDGMVNIYSTGSSDA